MLALALFSYGFYENTFMEVKGEPKPKDYTDQYLLHYRE
jgi:hypothetical protein